MEIFFTKLLTIKYVFFKYSFLISMFTSNINIEQFKKLSFCMLRIILNATNFTKKKYQNLSSLGKFLFYY